MYVSLETLEYPKRAHMGAEEQVADLGVGEEHQGEHDGECSDVRGALEDKDKKSQILTEVPVQAREANRAPWR